MHPILFTIGDFPIGTYGVLIVAGLLAGLWLAARLARQRDLRPELIYDLTFLLLVAGFVGARGLYILVEWEDFTRDPLAMLFSRGGFVFQGGLAAAVAAGVWFAWRRRLPGWEVADIGAPALALGHAIGRVGCFLAGCCYGRACPADEQHGVLGHLAVQYPTVTGPDGQPTQMFNFAYWGQLHDGLLGPGATQALPIVPVQLFETAGNLAICAVLLLLWRRRRFSGQTIALYLAGYGALRFGLEFLRGDTARGLHLGGTLSTGQLIALGMICAAAAIWALRRGRGFQRVDESVRLSTAQTGNEAEDADAAEGRPAPAKKPAGKAGQRGNRNRRRTPAG